MAVSAVLVLLSLSYLLRFVWPALELQKRLAQVIQDLQRALKDHTPQTLNLLEIERDIMADHRFLHIWQQYAHTLHARWMPTDAGPLGVARARVSQLSKSFFAEMSMASHGGHLDFSEIEQFTQSDPRMASLWQIYQLALEEVQQLEASGQHQSGGWQATAPAEHYFSEHALVDSPLQTHFYKNTRQA